MGRHRRYFGPLRYSLQLYSRHHKKYRDILNQDNARHLAVDIHSIPVATSWGNFEEPPAGQSAIPTWSASDAGGNASAHSGGECALATTNRQLSATTPGREAQL